MASGKEIRAQIKSISNTRKITSAMEMVAESKIRKAQDRMQLGKPYARRMRSVVGHIANSAPEYRHIYMEEREIPYVALIEPLDFVRWVFPRLFRARIPRY